VRILVVEYCSIYRMLHIIVHCTGVQQRKNFDRDGERKDAISNINYVNASHHMQRLYSANSSTASMILFPVTFRTAAAYLIAKVRLYNTFNISFKVHAYYFLLVITYYTLRLLYNA